MQNSGMRLAGVQPAARLGVASRCAVAEEGGLRTAPPEAPERARLSVGATVPTRDWNSLSAEAKKASEAKRSTSLGTLPACDPAETSLEVRAANRRSQRRKPRPMESKARSATRGTVKPRRWFDATRRSPAACRPLAGSSFKDWVSVCRKMRQLPNVEHRATSPGRMGPRL